MARSDHQDHAPARGGAVGTPHVRSGTRSTSLRSADCGQQRRWPAHIRELAWLRGLDGGRELWF
jgi:hypothetical protein